MLWLEARTPGWRPGMRVLLLCGLFLLVTRLPALLHPRAIDYEQVYGVVAIEMLHGGLPYQAAIERKPPLLFVLYAAVLGVAGPGNWPALHLVALVWTLATMWLLWLIAHRLFDPDAGLAAALLYGLFMAWADYRDLAFNGELIMNLPVVAAVALAFRPGAPRLRLELFVAGLLIAVAFLFKQPSGISGIAIGVYLLDPAYRARRALSWTATAGELTLLAAGFLGTLGACALVLRHLGILQEALYWTVLSQAAVFGAGTWVFWDRALSNAAFFALETAPLLLATVLSIRAHAGHAGVWRGRGPEFRALLVLLAVSCLGVAANGQFLFHYFLRLLPALALLAAPAAVALWNGHGLGAHPWLTPSRYRLWLIFSAVLFLVVDTAGLARYRLPGDAAVYVREHSAPTDRIFVWGQGDKQVGLYLDAMRRPASRYIASFPLTGHIFGSPVSWDPSFDTSDRIVPGSWENLAADFAVHPPRYIIDTDAVRNRPVYVMTRYPFLRDYLAANYRIVHRGTSGIVYGRTGAPQ